MTIKREILIKKNLLTKSYLEGSINEKAYQLAMQKLDEQIKIVEAKQEKGRADLNLFRQKMINR